VQKPSAGVSTQNGGQERETRRKEKKRNSQKVVTMRGTQKTPWLRAMGARTGGEKRGPKTTKNGGGPGFPMGEGNTQKRNGEQERPIRCNSKGRKKPRPPKVKRKKNTRKSGRQDTRGQLKKGKKNAPGGKKPLSH